MATVRRVRGLPLIGGLPVKALFQQPIFVDSNTGSDDNDGTNPEQPLATLADAFDSSKVGTNGVVIVLPGHSESVLTLTLLVFMFWDLVKDLPDQHLMSQQLRQPISILMQQISLLKIWYLI